MSYVNPFNANIQNYKTAIDILSKSLTRLSVARVMAFVISACLLMYFANERLLTLLLITAPICVLCFVMLIKHNNKVAYRKEHALFLKEINEQEVLRQENNLSGFATGQSFLKQEHPYVADFDVFGQHSLFQLINRTTTESGSSLLAKWLSEPAANTIIAERQQAIKELTPKLEWRQDLQAKGLHFKNTESDYAKLLAWLKKPEMLLPHKARYLAAAISLSLLSTLAAAWFLVHIFAEDFENYLLPLAIVLGINFFVLKRVKPIAEELLEDTHQNVKTLGGYHALIIKIEHSTFDSPLLKKLQSDLTLSNYSAAKEINKLRRILEVFKLRGSKKSVFNNQFYPLFNNFWLLDIYWIILTENWKHENSAHLELWVNAVSEFEVLSSMAGFAYSNPSFTFPEIKEEPYMIHFKGLGHPLLQEGVRVCNTFHLEGQGEIAMITGSNMAGKSTFLRTVGANLVLALMGAPCCASSGQVSNITIFSTMRTQDNLEEGISSFYAELKRVEQLLKLIESGQPVFFLLDEMFKGTNSKDRHRGGFSLIRQLKELNAFGIISTHDLDLADLAGKHGAVTNYSFNSDIQGAAMSFNYTLTPGLCVDFNASELMKRSGIKILSDVEEG
jgi:ABC-type multidrug transport system fused ATPase/permease subunit